MPTKLQPHDISDGATLSPRIALRLVTGEDWDFLDHDAPLTQPQLYTAWTQHKDALLHDLWLGQCHFYGTRLWSWWEYAAPQPRHLVKRNPRHNILSTSGNLS